MKVVLLHDWLTGFRGGERVLEVICEMFPDAPLYTLIYNPGSTTPIIENRKITASFINKLPGKDEGYRKYLPLFPLAARSLKIIEDADLVISSSHCVIKGVKKPKHAKHLCYIHSPMRYIYDQFDNYFGKEASLLQRIGGRLFRQYLTQWDIASNGNVDLMVPNSNFVKERVTKFYGIDSTVVHPFVDLKDFEGEDLPKEDFYLMVTAFAPNKKVGVAIEAFNQLGKTLKIIGGGQQEEYLKSIAGNNIEFLGKLSRADVVSHMKRATGFVFPGVEDFGITPLESLAAGTPVIAYKIGGVLETLNDQVAEFFTDCSKDGLIQAINSFEKKSFDRDVLKARARDFSKEKFKERIQHLIDQLMEKKS